MDQLLVMKLEEERRCIRPSLLKELSKLLTTEPKKQPSYFEARPITQEEYWQTRC